MSPDRKFKDYIEKLISCNQIKVIDLIEILEYTF